MNRILRSDVPEAVRRILELVAEPGILEVAPELGIYLDPYSRKEWLFLLGGDFWATPAVTVAAGGAGLVSKVQVRNPIGSGVLAVVTKVRASVAYEVRAGTEVTAAWTAAAFDVVRSDLRRGNNSLTPLLGLVRNNEAGASGVVYDFAPADQRWDGDPVILLPPGFSLYVNASALNTAITVAASGYLVRVTNRQL